MAQRITTLFLALVAASALSSCIVVGLAAAGGAVGVIQWDKNKATREFEAEFQTVWDSTIAAYQNLGYGEPEVNLLTKTEGEAEASDVWSRVELDPDGKTSLVVRVGTFDSADHRRRSELFMSEVARLVAE
jgi:hypothetical protein